MTLPTKAKVRLFIGGAVAFIFAGMLGTLLFYPVPKENADILKVLVGFTGGAFVTMVSFYFGDSDGKDQEVLYDEKGNSKERRQREGVSSE